jgi:hypothetical protein
MAVDSTLDRAKAELLADKYEARMADLGFVGTFFCADQRRRWREQIVRAFMGQSPSFQNDFTTPEAARAEGFPPDLPQTSDVV